MELYVNVDMSVGHHLDLKLTSTIGKQVTSLITMFLLITMTMGNLRRWQAKLLISLKHFKIGRIQTFDFIILLFKDALRN